MSDGAQPDGPNGPDHRAAFWSLVVGMPAALSVLRLWVESGGDLQVTLLLVSNVGPLNLGAALFATITQLATVVLIAMSSAGGILRSAVEAAPPQSLLRQRPPLIARIFGAMPPWFILAVFMLAILTWRIIYLPLLLPAAVAVAQRPLWRLHDRPVAGLAICLVGLAAYGWLNSAAVAQAWTAGEYSVTLLLILPTLAALGICGPVPVWFARLFATAALLAILGATAVVFQSAVRTPILPLVAIETKPAGDSPAEPGEDEDHFVRGHIITVNDLHLVVLQELGGVRYLPLDTVQSTVLCGTPEELPTFTIWLRGYHVEDSLLTAIGRRVRPRVRIDPLCRISEPAALSSGAR
ncbi:hypothetical protein ACFP2T_39200 [Plantactinospora solaniradicis]|uniref:Uncharacterized protein n=1 Tax=Plantactinospora solaniradicis TaxID=1723736 RepID=A0ABW1KMU9_9ACTN